MPSTCRICQEEHAHCTCAVRLASADTLAEALRNLLARVQERNPTEMHHLAYAPTDLGAAWKAGDKALSAYEAAKGK